MNDKVRALVLSVNDYQENDLILQVITQDKSFLSLIAKSAQKLNSKHHFNNLCIYEFIIDYKDNKTIYSIHGSKLVDSFYEDKDLKLLSFKNVLIELTMKNKELYEESLYNNITFTLANINSDNMYLLGSLFISYLLKISGICPMVDKCVVCGKGKVVCVSNSLGGFLCEEHKGSLDYCDVGRLKRFRLINKANFTNYEVIKNQTFDINDFDLIYCFYKENSEFDIKAYRLYKQLFA